MSNNYFNPFFTVKAMDGLFICNQTATKDQQFLMNNKFGLIINTCPLQFKVLPIPNVYKVMNFHWQNSRGIMIDSIDIKLFKPIFNEISRNLQEGNGVLVVSDRGHSRAITFALLYLMYRFQWELFKALEYINSKRENLQVRAAYLKLLVSYEKSLKSSQSQLIHTQISTSNKIKNQPISNNTKPQIQPSTKAQLSSNVKQSLPSQLKKQIRAHKQKWSQQTIKSVQQQLLSNTFRNTCKKHKINELNQDYREMLAQQVVEEKKLVNNNSVKNSTSEEWIRKSDNGSKIVGSSINKNNSNSNMGKNKGKKRVQFSNEIQIIIKESAVIQIFPQYEQLSPQHLLVQQQKQFKTATTKQQHVDSIHSHQNSQLGNNIANNSKGFNIQRLAQAKNNQLSPARPSSKKESTILNVTNSRMINIRRMQKTTNTNNFNNPGSSKNYVDTNIHSRTAYQNELIVMSNSQDLYSNEYHQSQVKQQQQKISNLISSSIRNKQKKEVYFMKQPFGKVANKLKQESMITKTNQTSTQFKNQQFFNYQIRPSSLKKFKASFIDQKQRKIFSPKKKQRKQQRILTEPKYDYEFQNPAIDEQTIYNKNSKRRLSVSPNQDQPLLYNDKIHQHKKSASTTMAKKMMNRFQKKSSTPIKHQKRCPTPQIITGQSNKQLRSSSHNNFFTRSLSRGGSNSLKMSTKKSVTSSIEQQGVHKQPKPSGAIFNVNINVNIGKLEMFGAKNHDSRQSITKSSANTYANVNNNKQKLTKIHSQIDKSQLLYNRVRSNSSNDNYSKFSISSMSIGEKQDTSGERFAKQKLINKDFPKVSQLRQHTNHERTQKFGHQHFIGHQPLISEDDNIFTSESFSKKEIMDKINSKLLKNSRNSKVQEYTKKSSILYNNFV